MLSEDVSSEKNSINYEEYFNTDFTKQTHPVAPLPSELVVGGYKERKPPDQNLLTTKVEERSFLQNLCCNPKYNKKLSIFLMKIHSKLRKGNPTTNEGFTDSESDDSYDSAEATPSFTSSLASQYERKATSPSLVTPFFIPDY